MPKTAPIAWDADAVVVESKLSNVFGVGVVQVERTAVKHPYGFGYVWTITFTTSTGPQPLLVPNPLHLVGSSPVVFVGRVRRGTLPDNYVSVTVPVEKVSAMGVLSPIEPLASTSKMSAIFNMLKLE